MPTLIEWKGVAGILHKVVSQVLVIPLWKDIAMAAMEFGLWNILGSFV